jgi:hypothetical protein
MEELASALHAIENGKFFFSSDVTLEMLKTIKQNIVLNENANSIHLK